MLATMFSSAEEIALENMKHLPWLPKVLRVSEGPGPGPALSKGSENTERERLVGPEDWGVRYKAVSISTA